MSSDETEPKNTERHVDDEQVASDIHDFRQLLRTADQDGLVSALESPDLFRMACDDPRYLAIAMQGIAVLAWDEPALASELLVRFDTNRAREQPDSDARRTARSLMAALEWRQLESKDWLPLAEMGDLRDFLRLYPALADDPEHGEELVADLRQRPAFYADFFQELAQRAQVLPEWIYRLEQQVSRVSAPEDPEPRGELSPLSDVQMSALSSTIAELRDALRSRGRQAVVAVAVLGIVVALPSAAGVLLALLAIGASMALGESKSYEQIVRPQLLRLAIEHGVGAKHVVSLLYRLSGKAGKVGNFDIKIENDRGLELLAALSRSAMTASTRAS